MGPTVIRAVAATALLAAMPERRPPKRVYVVHNYTSDRQWLRAKKAEKQAKKSRRRNRR